MSSSEYNESSEDTDSSDDEEDEDFVLIEPSQKPVYENQDHTHSLSQSYHRIDTDRYRTTSKQQLVTQSFVDNVLRELLFLFRSNEYQRYDYDIRRLNYAPIVILFDRFGKQSTVPRHIIQEYIEIFRAAKMMIDKVEEAKISHSPRVTWDVNWNFIEWSKQVNLLKKEIQEFFSHLDKVADDEFTVIEYNPEYYISSSKTKVFRPSKREQQRLSFQKMYYQPISIHAIDINWLYDLFLIFDKYIDLIPPVSVFHLFQQISKLFHEVTQRDQQRLIVICEDVLGGKSIESISTNLEKWMNTNRDVVPKSVLALFYSRSNSNTR